MFAIYITDKSTTTEPSGCGSEFGCYSSGCDGDACDFVITWLDGGGATVDFSLHLNLDKHPEFRNQWIALGLSSDASMGDDSVTECVQTGDAEATLAKSWNTGSPLNNIPLPDASNKTEGLSAMSRTVTDGVLMCSYSQTKVSTKQELYDLNTDWHLLVATGSSSGGRSEEGGGGVASYSHMIAYLVCVV
ncbi:FRS1L-like protein [Mya arenaria]|uniref:FRS1L-like protein n=1 Tax=Mya arenaria TaxID=6604 RepID=A0ABY7FPQ5_MYAAR|nr:FRS1L-like protein [Mya arenaria]